MPETQMPVINSTSISSNLAPSYISEMRGIDEETYSSPPSDCPTLDTAAPSTPVKYKNADEFGETSSNYSSDDPTTQSSPLTATVLRRERRKRADEAALAATLEKDSFPALGKISQVFEESNETITASKSEGRFLTPFTRSGKEPRGKANRGQRNELNRQRNIKDAAHAAAPEKYSSPELETSSHVSSSPTPILRAMLKDNQDVRTSKNDHIVAWLEDNARDACSDNEIKPGNKTKLNHNANPENGATLGNERTLANEAKTKHAPLKTLEKEGGVALNCVSEGDEPQYQMGPGILSRCNSEAKIRRDDQNVDFRKAIEKVIDVIGGCIAEVKSTREDLRLMRGESKDEIRKLQEQIADIELLVFGKHARP